MADPGKFIRTFIAVNLPEELRAKLAEVQRDLKSTPGGPAVRWTPAGQIHLTLRFLGNVPADSVVEIQAALQRACAAAAPFDLEAGGLGCFPNARQPRIIWVGLAGSLAALGRLQAQVESETAAWGEREERELHPHLTIGRVNREHANSARRLAEALHAKAAGSLGAWRVTRVDLMQSRLAPTGAEYSLLAAVTLPGQSGLQA